jgi:hypothetical protein
LTDRLLGSLELDQYPLPASARRIDDHKLGPRHSGFADDRHEVGLRRRVE